MTSSVSQPVEILLVDDRPNNLSSLQALLQRPGYRLVLARSGEEALAQILRHEFAVILLDVAMPGMDGFQVAAVIREREQSRSIPIIFVTASVYDMEHVFRGYTVGAVDYLRKPIDPHALRAKVAVFVELYRQRKEIAEQSARLREAELREQRLLRQRAEQALRTSESNYQLTFEEAPIGIGHLDANGRVAKANRTLGEILGYGGDALHGKPFAPREESAEWAAITERLHELRTRPGTYRGEHEILRGGETAWIQVTLTALRGVGQAELPLLAIVTDITSQKLAELAESRLVRELEQSLRTRDDFLSIAAHELKTPLTPLRLQVTSLMQSAEESQPMAPDQLLRRLGAIDRVVVRLEELIDRLLEISRIQAGAITLELEDVDLVTVASEIAERLRREAEQAGSSLSVEAAGPVVGRWDRARLEHVFSSLLSNAIKFGTGKPIEVTVTSVDGAARVDVRDHGIGIDAAEQERIFDRFERAAPLRHYGGFGLGLWTARRIVEAHDGHITVSSRPGHGSVFTVELPLQPLPESIGPFAPRAREPTDERRDLQTREPGRGG